MVDVAELAGVVRRTMADEVYEQIRVRILDGTISVGDELNQAHLARELNVSRVPVREALRRLQAERLIQGSPFQRYVVTGITPDVLTQLIDIREQLEVFAVRQHIEVLTPESTAALWATHRDLVKRRDPESWLLGDIELHAHLGGADTEASRFVREIRERVHRYVRAVVSSPARRREACAEHALIIQAMVDHDADAAVRLLRTHIRHTRDVLAEHSRSSDGGD